MLLPFRTDDTAYPTRIETKPQKATLPSLLFFPSLSTDVTHTRPQRLGPGSPPPGQKPAVRPQDLRPPAGTLKDGSSQVLTPGPLHLLSSLPARLPPHISTCTQVPLVTRPPPSAFFQSLVTTWQPASPSFPTGMYVPGERKRASLYSCLSRFQCSR